jgi:hypothetical protein
MVQKLNDALLKLDKFNRTKAEMSAKLAEQILFVRDLQRATGGTTMLMDNMQDEKLVSEFEEVKQLN